MIFTVFFHCCLPDYIYKQNEILSKSQGRHQLFLCQTVWCIMHNSTDFSQLTALGSQRLFWHPNSHTKTTEVVLHKPSQTCNDGNILPEIGKEIGNRKERKKCVDCYQRGILMWVGN